MFGIDKKEIQKINDSGKHDEGRKSVTKTPDEIFSDKINSYVIEDTQNGIDTKEDRVETEYEDDEFLKHSEIIEYFRRRRVAKF